MKKYIVYIEKGDKLEPVAIFVPGSYYLGEKLNTRSAQEEAIATAKKWVESPPWAREAYVYEGKDLAWLVRSCGRGKAAQVIDDLDLVEDDE